MAQAKKPTKAKQAKEAELVVEASPAKQEVDSSLQMVDGGKTEETEPSTQLPATNPQLPTAKAGRRSAKAIAEAEAKQAKAARKAEDQAEGEEKAAKPAVKSTRSKLERSGKRYKEAAKLIDKNKAYTLAEALDIAVKTANTKFDATVELHVNLGVDPRQADQNVRDMVVLPAGTGKKVRIAVLAEADDAKKATAAGADLAGVDEIFAKLDKEDIDFDVLIATPALMPRLGKYARLLGPRGLMPNPKSGTVSTDPAAAVGEAKAGRVEYRVDQSGIIHMGIGKASFGADKLTRNAEAVLASVKAAKPASLKGIYIKAIYVATTMGPGIKIDTAAV